ncbi:MAG TPA: hypothetical protein VGZ22_06120 [Isosphaeraceae bacterium]|nr:hypothetical protein [Isosphaeraceae bacterium]
MPHPERADRFFSHYSVRHLNRWPVQTSYTIIAADLADLLRRPPLNNPMLLVDLTSAGRAVFDLLRRAELSAWPRPIIITGGHGTSLGEGGAICLAKRDLVSSLQVVMQARRLRIAPLPEREVLMNELAAFRMKVTVSATDTLDSWRERPHDDLVLAVALAVWWGETHGGPPVVVPIIPGRGPPADRMNGRSAADRRGLYGRGRGSSTGW